MADWTEIVKAHTRTDRGRDKDNVSATVNFPICAYVTDSSSILF